MFCKITYIFQHLLYSQTQAYHMQTIQEFSITITKGHFNQIDFENNSYCSDILPRTMPNILYELLFIQLFSRFMLVLLGAVTSVTYIRIGRQIIIIGLLSNHLLIQCIDGLVWTVVCIINTCCQTTSVCEWVWVYVYMYAYIYKR